MAVTAEAYQTMKSATEGLRPADESPFMALTSVEQVLAYAFTSVRRDGGDVEAACDYAETLARSLASTPDEVRRYAATLAKIGYTELAARLREISGRRRHSLRPLT